MEMKRSSCYTGAFAALAVAAMMAGAFAWTSQAAAAEIGEVTIGGGIRSSIVLGDNGFPDTAPITMTGNNADAFDYNLDSMRLYTKIQVNEWTYVEFNTDYGQNGANEVNILDAVIKFSWSPKANLWIGRHLPPSDRSNLSGPYFLGNWEFPGLVQRYPAIFAGRDNGIQFWGRVGDEGPVLKYQIGLYEGYDDPDDIVLDGSDGPLIAARLTLNLLDNEDGPFNPQVGAYNMSTYYGTADVLAIGLTVQMQPDGATDFDTPSPLGTTSDDFMGYSVDVLFEKKIGDGGALTIEGAYYSYAFGYDPVNFTDNDQGLSEGTGIMGLVGFLLPGKIGPGQIRPYVRYQSYTDDTVVAGAAGENPTNIDIGVEYVFTQDGPPFGHQARATLNISIDDDDDPATDDRTQILLGMQVQF